MTLAQFCSCLGLGASEGVFAWDVQLLLAGIFWAGQAVLAAALANVDVAQDPAL